MDLTQDFLKALGKKQASDHTSKLRFTPSFLLYFGREGEGFQSVLPCAGASPHRAGSDQDTGCGEEVGAGLSCLYCCVSSLLPVLKREMLPSEVGFHPLCVGDRLERRT